MGPGRRVRLLDSRTVDQIAAGEVVERPASVVKELVENALDAGARRVEVRVERCGKKLIEVRDDGCGMSEADARLALLRHATSKIGSLEDLERATSLGFRGEALPSIASVSRFSLSTGEEGGSRVRLFLDSDGSQPVWASAPEAGPQGTTIRVEDLFYNTPARLKFLKTDATELGQIVEVVSRYAVAYPEVAFRLEHGESLLVRTDGSGDRLAAIAEVWGRETARALVEVRVQVGHARIEGFVSPPHFTRATRSHQWLTVNRRPVRSRTLTAALDQAYRALTPDRRFAVAVLDVSIDPALVDVNVSPTKQEVKFEREGLAFDALRAAIKGALLESGMMPSAEALARANAALAGASQTGLSEGNFGGSPSGGDGGMVYPSRGVPEWAPGGAVAGPTAGLQGGFDAKGDVVPQAMPQGGARPGPRWMGRPEGGLLPVASDAEVELWRPAAPTGVALAGAPSIEGVPGAFVSGFGPAAAPPSPGQARAEFLAGLRVIGQMMATFILAENRRGLLIVDQHVAHERILYEHLWASRGAGAIETQRLLVPVTLELDRRQAAVVGERLEELRQVGYELEPFGTGGASGTFLVRAVPAAFRGRPPVEALRDLAEQLASGADGGEGGAGTHVVGCLPSAREAVFAMAACKMAIKAGDPLGMPEMERLLLDLADSENPYLCPHGRPITLVIERHDLLKKFKRA